jgi:hypothetical protein
MSAAGLWWYEAYWVRMTYYDVGRDSWYTNMREVHKSMMYRP